MRYIFYFVYFNLIILKLVFAIDPNQFKPCFERYDGHKLFNATPFHSEYRMINEEECLTFCVKALSRCSSIVYDKYGHICYYFSVNGIEVESIERNARMVYLQIAEKQCVEDMQLLIGNKDILKFSNNTQQNMNVIEQIKEYAMANKIDTFGFGKINTDYIKSHLNVTLSTTPTTIPTTPTTIPTTSTTIPTVTENLIEFTQSFNNFNKILPNISSIYQKNSSNNYDSIYDTLISENGNLSQYSKLLNTTISIDNKNISIDIAKEIPDVLLNAIDTLPSFIPVMSSFTAIKRRPIHENNITINKSIDDILLLSNNETEFINDNKNNKFLNTNTDEENNTNFYISNSIRRHPQVFQETRNTNKKTNIYPQAVLPVIKTQSLSGDSNEYHSAVDYQFNNEPTIQFKNLPQSSVDYMSSLENTEYYKLSPCNEPGVNDIWLAIENAKFFDSNNIKNNHLSVQSFKACMNLCKKSTILKDGDACDSFTYFEASKKCNLLSVKKKFTKKLISIKHGDFSIRAFYRLCYPSSISLFSNCAEFLTFQYYSLDITPRELFNDLSTDVEGISACIELCVLATEFQCKSALFEIDNGICKLYDEHSLSSPQSFKEHTKSNSLYFENGCIDTGSVLQEISPVTQSINLNHQQH